MNKSRHIAANTISQVWKVTDGLPLRQHTSHRFSSAELSVQELMQIRIYESNL